MNQTYPINPSSDIIYPPLPHSEEIGIQLAAQKQLKDQQH